MQICSTNRFGEIAFKQLVNYSAEVMRSLTEETLRAGKECAKNLRQTSPKRTGKYAKSWTATQEGKSAYTVTVIVHNKKHYQLTHLLENGHATRNGGRTKAFPHVAKAEKAATEDYLRRAEAVIRG